MNENTKKYFKIGVLVAAILMIVSTFLPFLSVPGIYSASLLLPDGVAIDGILFIAFAAVAIVGAVTNKAVSSVAGSVAALVLWIYEMTQVGKLSIFGDLVAKGIGFYLMIVAVFAMLILSVLYFLADMKSKK